MDITFKHESLTIAPNEHIVRWVRLAGQEIGYIYSWRPYDEKKHRVYDPILWKMKLFFDANSFLEQTLGPDNPSEDFTYEEGVARESIPDRVYPLVSRRQMIDAGKVKPEDNSVYLYLSVIHHDVDPCYVVKGNPRQYLQSDGTWGQHFEFESIKEAQKAMRLAGVTVYKEQEPKITFKRVDLNFIAKEEWLASLGWEHVMTEEEGCDTWTFPWDLRKSWPEWAKKEYGTQHYWDRSEALELQERINSNDLAEAEK